MADDENIVENKKTISFTYMTWLDHARAFFQVQWKKLAIYSIAIFGVMWGVIEAASFFAPKKIGVRSFHATLNKPLATLF
ncbi:MAG: hypothetical protein JKX92_10150 [Porticoccaceae bacterium]|nr:hypothetical protein [Porticoccaceae bacterium]